MKGEGRRGGLSPGAARSCMLLFVMGAVAAGYHFWTTGGGPPTRQGAQPNFRGAPTLQLFQKMEALRPWYTEREAAWDVGPLLIFSKDHWEVPIAACAAYLLFLSLAPALGLKLQLTVPFALWNWLLAVFSLVGALRTVPELLYNLTHGPFEDTICTSPDAGWGVGATGLWVQLFIFSKLPELGDTVFIILKGKKVIFLHWYHHVTVLLYCWHAYATECGAGLWFVAMNYTVHAVMYCYYCAASLRLVPRWFPPIIITAMQIAQMFVGMFVCAASIYFTFARYGSADPCHNDTGNLVGGGVMYMSYLALFLHFAYEKYFAKKTKTE